jgi:trehalose-6-phosphate synthase
MLGVDRLDMIKGIPQKLLAFEKFLQVGNRPPAVFLRSRILWVWAR